MAETIFPTTLPLIALKNTVLFPKVAISIIVQRSKSLKALQTALAANRLVLFVTQKNFEDDITERDLFRVGTIGRVTSVFTLPDGSSKIDVEGLLRAEIARYEDDGIMPQASVRPLDLARTGSTEEQALIRRVMEGFRTVADLRSFPAVLPEVVQMLFQLKDIEQVAGLIAANLNLEVQDQQKVLEKTSVQATFELLNTYLARESDILETERRVTKETRQRIGKMQKEAFLREQLKSIEKELGVEDDQQEFDQLRKRIAAAKMPKDVQDKALKELGRLEKMPPFSPEVSFLRTYLDWLVELPWNTHSKEQQIDLKRAEKILNEDHYGLTKAKERIVEYLAVKKQVSKLKGPILCFVGPPGTGKTSIGKSIARALGRTFVRVSLGGLRDEAEIRGHRRTYVGALPGRIIQGIHTAKARNPVFMLDEIDKVGADFRGDPSAALLEALDPEQNHAFSDHYLEVPYDLSDVLFIVTANMLDTIPPALRDRLEIIEFPGYSEDEKLRIADKFLIPKLLKDHGLTKKALTFRDSAVRDVIHQHTREAGVRDLERQLATIVRKVTRQLVEKPSRKQVGITKDSLHAYLGPVRYTHQVAEAKDEIGVVLALAWTPVGGEVFPIEVAQMPGKGRLILTGQQGDVMKESAQAALSFARAYVVKKGVKEEFAEHDIHIHMPSGAVKKDGPSAGTAITTALVSLLLGRPARRDVAMTGEVTLRGKVMEIGGVKEKVLAAHRAGIKTVIMPIENKKDLEDIPKEVKKELKFVFAKTVEDVLKVALK